MELFSVGRFISPSGRVMKKDNGEFNLTGQLEASELNCEHWGRRTGASYTLVPFIAFIPSWLLLTSSYFDQQSSSEGKELCRNLISFVCCSFLGFAQKKHHPWLTLEMWILRCCAFWKLEPEDWHELWANTEGEVGDIDVLDAGSGFRRLNRRHGS